MLFNQEQYDKMEIGQKYVVKDTLMEKLMPLPPVMMQSNADHGKATVEDAEKYPYFEGRE